MFWMRRMTIALLAASTTFASFAACAQPVATCRSNISGELAEVTDELEELAREDRNASTHDAARRTIREWFSGDDGGDESISDTIRRWFAPKTKEQGNDV